MLFANSSCDFSVLHDKVIVANLSQFGRDTHDIHPLVPRPTRFNLLTGNLSH